ncbi:hypothetical protein F4818DRAFT_439038 [Hypoxylon cercidicola]|nr:hypothetical protein F4818DRAFT_439038 [Hypoxylon cercidicola]
MEHDRVVNINLRKDEYDEAPPQPRPSVNKPASTAGTRSCIVCRKTLLLSYFNCCGICLGVIECSRPRKQEGRAADSLPTVEPPRRLHGETSELSSTFSSSATAVEGRSYSNGGEETATTRAAPPHCNSTYCKYTHLRPLMAVFVLCELFQFASFLVSLSVALYRHDWLLLRYAGLILLQWWQIFMLARQAMELRPFLVAGQLAAAFFMVWYYVESSQQWRW